jgi:ATP-binding cassette subfamily C protein
MCDVISPDSGQILRMVANPLGGNSRISGGVSYVPQKPGLVSGTILDNIALAENPKEVDRDLVMEALELAHLSATIRELPLGLDTPLGKLQDGLSGGQMQRLGLARALYSKPSLLVMDEATSALDAESEAIIQSALDSMKGRVTVVLIAHRLNTVQFADKVLLIEGGKLTDYGTFTELLRKNKSVQELVNLMKIHNS